MIRRASAIRTIAILASLLVSGTSAHARGPGVTSMDYADLAAWAAFRSRQSETQTGLGQGDPAAAHNPIKRRFVSASDAFAKQWGGLPNVRLAPGPTLAQGATGPRVTELRQRLGLVPGTVFDSELAARISQYRRAHGLSGGSQADAALIGSLNRGYAHYRRLIDLNVKRASMMPGSPGRRFVLVDSAEQRLYMYQDGNVVGSMKVIVGKVSDQTPMMAGFISYSEINPYWNVPADLVRDRYANRVIRGGKSYLDTRGFEVFSSFDANARKLTYADVDWKAVAAGRVPLRMRQRPGAGNGMGRIKFMFPNRFGVYLHDTPSVALFDKADRTLSAGCVRVERPWDLAEWLYGQRLTWQGRPAATRVALPEPVPVYLTYLTAVPTAHGFSFRPDVYRRDNLGI